MHLNALRIVGFRSYADQTIRFDPKLTMFVGENDTGKSSIVAAVSKLLAHATGSPQYDGVLDFPYGRAGLLRIEAVFDIDDDDIEFLTNIVLPGSWPDPEDPALRAARAWILRQPCSIELVSSTGVADTFAQVLWGDLTFDLRQVVTAANPLPSPISTSIMTSTIVDILGNDLAKSQWTQTSFDLVRQVGIRIADRYKHLEEFRQRGTTGRNTALESMSGGETASVLLNLKNHSRREERDRYQAIKDAFHGLFSRYQIEAVEASPGSGTPVVQFWEDGRSSPLSLTHVSAGVNQVLTFLVNLIGQRGLIVALEHPEQHLHPHGMRFLQQLIGERSHENQVVVVTHDPHFVTVDGIKGLRRVWWTSDHGTLVYGPDLALSDRERSQIQTVLGQLANREMMFSRCVILVEDQTQAEFLVGVAPVLGFDLDARAISVIPVGSEDGYAPFLTLLHALRIPHVALRDKHWADSQRYPREWFYSMGMEIEDYLDQHGLQNLREKLGQELGRSKRRVGGALGHRLEAEQVPALFGQLLEAAIKLTTGEPEPLTAPG